MKVDLYALVKEALLKNEASLIVNKIHLRVNLFKNPKRLCYNVSNSTEGCGSATNSLEETISCLREGYYRITKQDLEEVTPPEVRQWYVTLKNGKQYPFTKSSTRPVMSDYLIEAEGEQPSYLLQIDSKLYPELDYEIYSQDRSYMYVYKYDVFGVSDYFRNSNG